MKKVKLFSLTSILLAACTLVGCGLLGPCQEPETDPIPLVVDAGADQTLTDSDGDGSEPVTLEGSASAPPGGNIVEMRWLEGSSVLGTGARLTVSFGVGTHTVAFEVTSDDGRSGRDIVNIEITAKPIQKCAADNQCDDGDPCTQDVCANGFCENSPGCRANSECDDGDPCTADICAEGCCENTPGCRANSECDDRDPCTTDVCTNGCCENITGCTSNSECDDGDPCTADVCSEGCCENISGCTSNSECDDGDPCTADICAEGCCENTPACTANGECDDADPCTADECVDGCCENMPECMSNSECDDYDPATADECVDGCCQNTFIGMVYWTDVDTGKLRRASLDGSSIGDVFTGLQRPTDVAIDTDDGIYFVDHDAGTIEGPGCYISGRNEPWGIALDLDGGKIYWTETDSITFDDEIWRANLDGSNPETALGAPHYLRYLAVNPLDVCGGWLYWTRPGDEKIQRACIDCFPGTEGSCAEDSVTGLAGQPLGIALDFNSGSMFWTNPSTHEIWRANLSGGNATVCYDFGVSTPVDIAVDSAAGDIYWTDQGSQSIKRGQVDCSGQPETVVNTGSTAILGIALDVDNGG